MPVRIRAHRLDADEPLEVHANTGEHIGDCLSEIERHVRDASGETEARGYRCGVALPPQRRQWSAFVLGVGLVLMGLCALDRSTVALALGMAMVLVGLLGLLLGA